MESVPRFKASASNVRPYNTHRYDVYAPKLQRQVRLFGRNVLDLWTALEANPEVVSYCERPLIIPDSRPQRAIDFWVRKARGEELLILLREGDSEAADKRSDGSSVGALTRSTFDGIPVVYIDPKDYGQRRVSLNNWGTILRDLAAFQRFVPEPLCREVLNAIGPGRTIGQLQSELLNSDSSVIRLAVFVLLHRGQATCKQLETQPIGSSHFIERS